MARRNEEVAALLDNIAKLLALKGENPFRLRAYTTAARAIQATPEDIEDLHRAGRLDEIPGVGTSIATKVAEYLDTGRLRYYEDLKKEISLEAAELLDVPSIGPVRAKLIHERLGISTLPELIRAASEHRLQQLPGFGKTLEERIAREAARVAQRSGRMLLGVALPAAEEVVALLRDHPAVRHIAPAGSLRRYKETIGDIDILVASDRPAEVMDAFARLPVVAEVLAKGPTRASVLTRRQLQIDLRAVRPEEYGSALQYFTGSKDHNIALRALAMSRGWKLSEYGLFDQRGRRLAGETEEEVYHALGMDWIPPELRENRGEIEAARAHRLPHLVQLHDLRGDLHIHTNWSDGLDTLEKMVEAAMARGYEYLAITDHSRTLGMAGGLSIEQVRQQRRLIDRLNERYAPFRILHGTELDILPDGRLDYPDEVLAEFDIVGVSIHSAFGQPRDQMTARIIKAISHPYVDVLNHPTGRLLQRRPEYEVDLEAVLQAAVTHGVAMEIDGQPDRLDLSDTWARRAKVMGLRLICDSDAHSSRQLDYVRYAVAMARRGWLERSDVLNTLPLKRLLAYLARRRRKPRAA